MFQPSSAQRLGASLPESATSATGRGGHDIAVYLEVETTGKVGSNRAIRGRMRNLTLAAGLLGRCPSAFRSSRD